MTYALIAINVAPSSPRPSAAAGSANRGGGTVIEHGALYGPRRSRPATSTGGWSPAASCTPGFLHIGFNMYLLYLLGRMLEPALGPVRFVALYFASLLAGLVRRAAGHARTR